MRSLPGYARARQWRAQPARSLLGASVTILGGGGIASALLGLLGPLVVAAALTPQTRGAVDAATLARLPGGPGS